LQNIKDCTEILRGKDAKNNKRILNLLAKKREPVSVSEITKNLLPKNTSIYSKKYATLNPTIYRRVQALTEMEYLVKDKKNKVYLSLKGYLLSCILFPDVIRSMPLIIEPKGQYPKIMGFKLTESFFTQAVADFMLVRPFEKLLFQGKINLDVISNDELVQLMDELGTPTALTIRNTSDKNNVKLEDWDIFVNWLENEIIRHQKLLAVAKEFREEIKTRERKRVS
jgi:hypothetical protein